MAKFLKLSQRWKIVSVVARYSLAINVMMYIIFRNPKITTSWRKVSVEEREGEKTPLIVFF